MEEGWVMASGSQVITVAADVKRPKTKEREGKETVGKGETGHRGWMQQEKGSSGRRNRQ